MEYKSMGMLLQLLFLSGAACSLATLVTVDTENVFHVTDDHYISFTIDSGFFGKADRWTHLDYRSPRLASLLSALAPCILRVGGTNADKTFFNTNVTIVSQTGLSIQSFTQQDWYNLNWLVRGSGLRLLFDLNLQQRFGQNWDPTNAAKLMNFTTEQGLADNIDFELGNEPGAFDRHDDWLSLDPDQIGRDLLTLKALTQYFPMFSKGTRIVGPDVAHVEPDTNGGKILKSVANIAGDQIHALTFHHYYFNGATSKVGEYLNPDRFDGLKTTIDNVTEVIKSSPNPHLPYWIGETADAYDGGTPGVSDRFVSGFLWLDKLGLSAAMGVGVVMRQTFYGGNYGLVSDGLVPNPDYWLSVMFHRLVGNKVLSVSTPTSKPATTRVYAHCANQRYPFPQPYPAGSVTVYGLNMANLTETIKLSGALANQDMDVYLMTPGDNLGILAKTVKVNGKVVEIQGDHVPVQTEPMKSNTSKGLVLPPQTFGFFVLPNANVQVCI